MATPPLRTSCGKGVRSLATLQRARERSFGSSPQYTAIAVLLFLLFIPCRTFHHAPSPRSGKGVSALATLQASPRASSFGSSPIGLRFCFAFLFDFMPMLPLRTPCGKGVRSLATLQRARERSFGSRAPVFVCSGIKNISLLPLYLFPNPLELNP